MSNRYDVAVIGASLAGSSLAIGLGRLGIKTALIDRASFPRRKPCGEGLSNVGVAYLRRLGLKDEIKKLPHSEFCGYTVWTENNPIEISFSDNGRTAIRGWGVERFILDNLLVSKAQAFPSVDALLGVRVREVREGPDGYELLADDRIIKAKYLVLADGVRSVFSTRLGFVAKYNPSQRFGYSMVFDGKYDRPLDHVHMILKGSFEAVCTPTGPNRLNVTVLADKAHFAEILLDKTQAMLRSEINSKIGFSGELFDEPMSIGPLGRVNRIPNRGNTILIGDCCENLDPIGGMGMTHALLSSSIACEAFKRIFSNESSAQQAFAWYADQRERRVRPLRGFTRLTYMTLKQNGNGHLLKALSATPLLRSVSERVNSVNSTSLLTSLSGVLLGIIGAW
jgi:flavin-dependent dehydrogenase